MSSTILTIIVLVVMWLVVLVPMFVRRGEESVDPQAAEQLGLAAGAAARVLPRRAEAEYADDVDALDEVRTPVTTASVGLPLDRYAADDDELELDLDPEQDADQDMEVEPGSVAGPPGRSTRQARPVRRRGSRRAMLARRRRALTALSTLTLLTLVVVVLSGGGTAAWYAQLGCDVLLAAYLAGLRRIVRRERVRRAVRQARARASRARASARRTVSRNRPMARRPAPPVGQEPEEDLAEDDLDPPQRRAVGG